MDVVEQSLSTIEMHPVDIVETLAASRAWDFDRVDDDQIALAVEGQWRTYTLSLSWAGHDDTIRLLCTFELSPPEARLDALRHAMALANDEGWGGAFCMWEEHDLMVHRSGMTLAGDGTATGGQLDAMLREAVARCERFYPAFQLVCWGDSTAEEAMEIAMPGAYGRA